MYQPSRKVLHHEDRKFQGGRGRELWHRDRRRYHRCRTPAEEFFDAEVPAGTWQPRRVEQTAKRAADHALSAVELLPTIPDPEKIFCIGVNYATHLAESGH